MTKNTIKTLCTKWQTWVVVAGVCCGVATGEVITTKTSIQPTEVETMPQEEEATTIESTVEETSTIEETVETETVVATTEVETKVEEKSAATVASAPVISKPVVEKAAPAIVEEPIIVVEETQPVLVEEPVAQIVEEAPMVVNIPDSQVVITDNPAHHFDTYHIPEQMTTTDAWILNMNTMKVHKPNGCHHIAKIKPEHYATSNLTLDEVIASGYIQCQVCW